MGCSEAEKVAQRAAYATKAGALMAYCNVAAVPEREYKSLESVSDEILAHMQAELSVELQALRANLRELGAKRNGLRQVETEIMLRTPEAFNE